MELAKIRSKFKVPLVSNLRLWIKMNEGLVIIMKDCFLKWRNDLKVSHLDESWEKKKFISPIGNMAIHVGINGK